jgi:hypothetical protein
MSINPYSPLLKMTKAPPGFRDPIYEKAAPVKVSSAQPQEGLEKKIVAKPSGAASKVVLEVATKLSHLNLK